MRDAEITVTIGPDGKVDVDIEAPDDDCDKTNATVEAVLECLGLDLGEKKGESRHPRQALPLPGTVKVGGG